MRFVAFLATILLLTAVSWLLVGAFVLPLVPGGWRTIALAWAVSVVPVFVLIRNIATGRYPSAAVRLFLFRGFWYAQLLMILLAFASAAGGLLGLPFGLPAETGRIAILIFAPALVVLALWGYVGTRRLVVREVKLQPPNLPPALDGLRIVQLSDLHVGPHTSRAQLERIAAATVAAHPHIIAYTGDQVDDHPRDIDVFASAFGQLTAPLGVYAIAGNHDVYAGWSEVRRRLEAMGVTVLVNSAVKLEHQGSGFWVAGTGDPAGMQFSIPSHGWSLASVFLEYSMGTYERDGSLLYISPGTNFWGIPFRIGALPEVTVVTLAAAPSIYRKSS